MASKQIVIGASTLYDGKTKRENVYIIVEDRYVIDVTAKKLKPHFQGVVTPAFIDAHSHIGMQRQGEPAKEAEVDDRSDQFAPLGDPVDSIYFDDRAFSDALDFGVLYSCVVPGSGNLFGGQAKVIRNFTENRKHAVIKDYGFKMALGYNPRFNSEWDGPRPNTRMGLYSLLKKYLDEIIRKEEKARIKKDLGLLKLKNGREKSNFSEGEIRKKRKWLNREYELALSQEQRAIFRLLKGEGTAKVHVHKEDDALFLIELVKEYGIKATADHASDIFHTAIFDELADNHIPVIYGPLGSIDYKVELKHALYQNTRFLIQSKALYGLMTDHPVILTHHLRESLKYFLIQGMKEEEAISLITFKNAKILGLDNQLGTIEKGKLASIVLWDRDPFHLGSFPLAVFAEGDLIRSRQFE